MSLRLVFLGNGPFAVPILDRIFESPHELLAVVVRPDKPHGKHRKITPGPVRRRAEERQATMIHPEDVNDESTVDQIRQWSPDLLVVADFGQILSPACLQGARLGGINAHASLLPKYRGAAPVAWAIFHGETQTGVSIIQMTPKLDAGGVIASRSMPIGADQTAGELEAQLSILAADLTLESIAAIENGKAHPIPQDSSIATKAPKLKKEDGRVRWSRTASEIRNQVRAMQPWPGCFTKWHSQSGGEPLRIGVLNVAVELDEEALDDSNHPTEAGVVVASDKEQLVVKAGAGCDRILTVQPAGKKSMPVDAFLRGRNVRVGDRFE